MMENDKGYPTIDLALSAYLITKGKKIQSISHRGNSKRRKATIIFEKTDDLIELVDKYFDNTATVPPREYADNIRGLKSRIVNAVD